MSIKNKQYFNKVKERKEISRYSKWIYIKVWLDININIRNEYKIKNWFKRL
jgi:hypothetical protein